jgi:hypothetical protein
MIPDYGPPRTDFPKALNHPDIPKEPVALSTYLLGLSKWFLLI